MPSPLSLLLSPIFLASSALYAGLLACEKLCPARALPAVPGWWWRGLSSFLLLFLVSSYLPLWLEGGLSWLVLLDLGAEGTLPGFVCLTLLYQLFLYGWHRAMHESNFLFRTFHQMHHSAERLDVSGAFWFSPLDMIGFTLLSALAAAIVRVSADAAVCFALFSTLLSLFQHTNIKTPRWLGLFVQRPESHSHHHARFVHHGNYADLPVFDLLFGSFVNPAHFAEVTGFYDGASARVTDMVLLRDVTRPARSSRPSFAQVRTESAS